MDAIYSATVTAPVNIAVSNINGCLICDSKGGLVLTFDLIDIEILG